MPHQLSFCLIWSIQLLEFLDKGFSHWNQCLLWPWKEPINGALAEEGRELSKPISELLSDRRETKANVEIIPDSIDEIVVKFAGSRISSFELFDVVVSGISQEGLSLIFGEESWNLTCRQDHVNIFKECLLFNFSICEDEAAVSSEPSCYLEVLLNIFFQILLTIIFHQLNLLELHSLNKWCQTGQGLLSTTTNTHQQGRRSWLLQYTIYLQQMLQRIIEQHEL